MAVRRRYLTAEFRSKFEKYFAPKVAARLQGQMWSHETTSGGIHYTGQLKQRRAVVWELQLRQNGLRAYMTVLIAEYANGSIVHVHFEPSTSKGDLAEIILLCSKVQRTTEALLDRFGQVEDSFIPIEFPSVSDQESQRYSEDYQI